jgi:pimeloyl-ACP methyl ester carboxylesterase
MTVDETVLHPPRVEHTVPIADGRVLGVAEFGAEGGRPILWFHGTPGARRQVPPAARAVAEDMDVRIIGVERPGTGNSTPHLYADVRAYADDIEVLADRLGIEEFGLIGLSGGGPYVLACAHELPDRVAAAVVLGGVAPTCGEDAARGGLVDLTRTFRHPIALARRPLGLLLTSAVLLLKPIGPQVLSLYSRVSPPGDRLAFAAPGMKDMFLDDLNLAAGAHGLRAVTHDVVLFGRHWGFPVTEIRVPVRFWHGDADHIVPLEHARHLADLVPDAELHVRHGESHLGTLVVGDEAVRTVVDLWPT